MIRANRCRECGYWVGGEVPDHILEKCWECRFREEGRQDRTCEACGGTGVAGTVSREMEPDPAEEDWIQW